MSSGAALHHVELTLSSPVFGSNSLSESEINLWSHLVSSARLNRFEMRFSFEPGKSQISLDFGDIAAAGIRFHSKACKSHWDSCSEVSAIFLKLCKQFRVEISIGFWEGQPARYHSKCFSANSFHFRKTQQRLQESVDRGMHCAHQVDKTHRSDCHPKFGFQTEKQSFGPKCDFGLALQGEKWDARPTVP